MKLSELKINPKPSCWNQTALISAIAILIFLTLPWIFIRSSVMINEQHVAEKLGVGKFATELLSPKVWWPLLICSLLFFGYSLYMAIRSSSPKLEAITDLHPKIITRQLALLGGLSLVIYILFFLLPFSLHRYYYMTRVSIGWIADRSWVAAIALSFILVTLFLFYLTAYRLTQNLNSRPLWMIVLVSALLFGIVNFFVFPISSTDLYDYVSRGRIAGIYGGNPFVQVPNDYPDDEYVQLAAWIDAPSAYGPLWEILGGLIGRFSGGPLWNDMIGYKIIALLSYLLTTVMIAAILQRLAPDRSLAGTLLFAWNPLVILEAIANAHNDMIMMAFVLGGFLILSHVHIFSRADPFSKPDKRYFIYASLAMMMLTLSILVKYIPILLLPPFLLYYFSLWKGWKKKYAYALFFLLPITLLVFSYYQIFWKWPEIGNIFIHRTTMFRMSLGSMTYQFIEKFIPEITSPGIASWIFLGGFIVFYLLILVRTVIALRLLSFKSLSTDKRPNNRIRKFFKWIRTWMEREADQESWDILMSACLHILLIYLLLGSLWFWPWYLIWPVALLPLCKDERLIAILMVVCCVGQLSIILWNFVWYWMGIEWNTLHIIENLIVALFLLPTFGLYLKYRKKENQLVPDKDLRDLL